MMQERVKTLWKPTLLSLALLLTSCAAPLKPKPVNLQPQVPPLPSSAEQPQLPLWCEPSCAAGLSAELKPWQDLLIEAEQRD